MQSKIYSYMYSNFVKRFYKRFPELEDNEEIYYRKHRLVVKVKDEEIRQRLCNVVKLLKDRKEKISTSDITFEIEKYIIDNNGGVESFQIYFNIERDSNIHELASKIGRLKQLVKIANAMKSKGYILDESVFECQKCNSISALLSFFVPTDVPLQNANGCLIKYIHYVLTDGGDFEQYYQEIVANTVIRKVSEYPYSLPVVRMCYNYFSNGDVPGNILEILLKEEVYMEFKHPYANYLIADKNSLNSNSKQIVSNEEYTIYEGNIKIYHEMDPHFQKNLITCSKFLDTVNESILERIDTLIIDFNENVVGYKFLNAGIKFANSIISNKKLKSQKAVIDFVGEIRRCLKRNINLLHENIGSLHEDFDVEKFLVCKGDSSCNFKVTEIKQLFNLTKTTKKCLRNQITNIFFKLFLSYINHKYGEITDEEQFLEKNDIKYLSPILARQFINYALGQKVDYPLATESLYQFLDNSKRNYTSDDFYYDSRLKYDPLCVSFCFDYQFENKHSMKIEKGTDGILSDGRVFVIFERVRKVSNVEEKEIDLYRQMRFARSKRDIRISSISEMIFSRNLDSDGMYYVAGYITTPIIKGIQLTDDFLLSLNNKELYKVEGYLLELFDNSYIPLDTVWMEGDFVFNINIFDKEFKIEKNKSKRFTQFTFDRLVSKGYNPNAFIGIENVKSFSAYADTLDAYCDEHGIYYDSTQKQCPVCQRTKYIVDADFEKNANMIFEDLYAKHYRIDGGYNLKAYKTNNIDINEVQENVDKIVSSQLYSKKILLGQECFVPSKKALLNDGTFIGYVYNQVDFDTDESDGNLFNDIRDQQRLKNLPRLMSLIRLMLQVKEVMKRDGLSFMKNPFTHVFLSRNHKKQVQILNVEFFAEKGREKDTRKWLREYVSETVVSDSSIEVNLSDCPMDLEVILTRLQNSAKGMTKYCGIHGIYYKNDYLFCPKCIDKAQMENVETEEVDKAQFTFLAQFNEGGESVIYPYGDACVVKVFKEENINYALKCAVILRVLKRREILEEINSKNFRYKYILPKKLFVDTKSRNFYSYLMNKVEGGMVLSTLRDKAQVEKLGFTRKDVLQILIAVGRGIEILHDNGIFIGDLNGRNILFDKQKNVYFIDFDGMGVDEICPEFCTDGYIDPVSKKNQSITMKDDWYSFAVQAFYYLTFSHPFNGIYSVEENGKKIMLDLTDKMERRISLLGKHGMKPPSIAESWDWMNEELKNAFLDIFESDNRESIVPYLVRQYSDLFAPIRINSKFVARKRNRFGKGVAKIINHYSAVCEQEGEYYISILLSNGTRYDIYEEDYEGDDVFLPDCFKIENILLSDDNSLAFFIYDDEIDVIDLESRNIIFCRENWLANNNAVVNGRTLYYTEATEGNNVIHQINFLFNEEVTGSQSTVSNEGVKEEIIKFLPEKETKCFYAKFNSKFVLVKKISDTDDEVYCNSQKLCVMYHSSGNSQYNILYDDVTKLWLVVSNEGNLLIINSSNEDVKRISLQENISDITDIKIENMAFNKGRIYVPSQDCLYIINVKDQLATKKMECNKIMAPDSKLYDINTNGFSVITDDIFYEVRKG